MIKRQSGKQLPINYPEEQQHSPPSAFSLRSPLYPHSELRFPPPHHPHPQLSSMFKKISPPISIPPPPSLNSRVPPGCRLKKRWNVDVSISTGQNHIVKKNFAKVKISVKTLERINVGCFKLGEWGR